MVVWHITLFHIFQGMVMVIRSRVLLVVAPLIIIHAAIALFLIRIPLSLFPSSKSADSAISTS